MNKLANNLTKHTPEIFASAVLQFYNVTNILHFKNFKKDLALKQKNADFFFKNTDYAQELCTCENCTR